VQISNQAAYDDFVAKNTDPYGKAALNYGVRWADLMEKHLSEGKALTDIAEADSHEADTDYITGFMYGCAVLFLAQTWVHGEALRRWHNAWLNPDQADSPGVLNPALVTFVKKE